jgi:hypothetical protein
MNVYEQMYAVDVSHPMMAKSAIEGLAPPTKGPPLFLMNSSSC